ncbi:MAG: HIT domain-containing protein [Burkholderiaceae bacterium]|nr:HIT domain-containing protein [Burkholderiaceae bacterium]
MKTTISNCPFCRVNDNEILRNSLAYVRRDVNPVTPGHLLIIPVRHVASYFETTDQERVALLQLLTQAKGWLEENHAPSGYNIGINVGEAAGQTIPHVHVHLIPRYLGDVTNPRGGVRGVIPAKQSY